MKHAARCIMLMGVLGLWASAAAAADMVYHQDNEPLSYQIAPPRHEVDTSVLPACDSDWALGYIRKRFAQKEGGYWDSALRIQGFSGIQEIAYRPWGQDVQVRRFCTGSVTLSNGQISDVFYSLVEHGGMTGMGWGVEWCVVGTDRNLAYAPACKMARP